LSRGNVKFVSPVLSRVALHDIGRQTNILRKTVRVTFHSGKQVENAVITEWTDVRKYWL